jgi:hypothetical protein
MAEDFVHVAGRAPCAQAARDLEDDTDQRAAVTVHAPAAGQKATPELARPQQKSTGKKKRKRKATFRVKPRRKKQQVEKTVELPETWRNKREWMQLPEKQKWRSLPKEVQKFAKPGAQSFTCQIEVADKSARIECLLRERAYWVRTPATGAEACQRHHAWLKNGGPFSAWEAAVCAAGVR